MEIRTYTDFNEEEILRLYQAVGWSAYTENPSALKQGFLNSLVVLAAYEKDELQGIIRAVGDGFTVVFVQDILVFPKWQRHGVGTALLKALFAKYPNVRQIELITDDTPKTTSFYRSVGFQALSDIGLIGFFRCI